MYFIRTARKQIPTGVKFLENARRIAQNTSFRIGLKECQQVSMAFLKGGEDLTFCNTVFFSKVLFHLTFAGVF